ncbi:DNA gyrase subunit B [Polynucleobacter paneuropaeus]|nr:DNA gyrase subunit B [Polynucleobacter paneuropaeus]
MEFLLAILLPISIWVFKFFGIPFWVAGVFLIPLILLKKNPYWGKALALVALVLGGASLLLRTPDFVYFYPVMVNAVLLSVFVSSLYRPQTIVEKIARLRDPRFSDLEIPYARKVTIAWALFFVINGCVALITVLIEDKFYWSIYNGAISYLLMGLMFAGELYCRKRYIKSA